MGNASAVAAGMKKAPTSVEDSVQGIISIVSAGQNKKSQLKDRLCANISTNRLTSRRGQTGAGLYHMMVQIYLGESFDGATAYISLLVSEPS